MKPSKNPIIVEPPAELLTSVAKFFDMDDSSISDTVSELPTSEINYVKHRRTRSGCYTCRSRRVKVFSVSCSHGSQVD